MGKDAHFLWSLLSGLRVRDQLVLLVVIVTHAHAFGPQLHFNGLADALLVASQALSFLQTTRG